MVAWKWQILNMTWSDSELLRKWPSEEIQESFFHILSEAKKNLQIKDMQPTSLMHVWHLNKQYIFNHTWSPLLIGGKSDIASRIVIVRSGAEFNQAGSSLAIEFQAKLSLTFRLVAVKMFVGFGNCGRISPGAAARRMHRRRDCGTPKCPA